MPAAPSSPAAPGAWSPPPPDLRLPRGAVHVWRAGLELPDGRVAAFHETLSADEREKAARFVFARDRAAYVAGRGILRALLGRYLGVPPAGVRFRYGPYGKPSLDALPGALPFDLHFNVSHAAGVALFTFSRDRVVGVDVEGRRPLDDYEALARRFFAPEEWRALQALPAGERDAAFFACWTRKEAFLKALGFGLSLALDRFAVSVRPGAPAVLLHVEGDARATERWRLCDLDAGPGHAAALAVALDVEGPYTGPACWQWPDDGTCFLTPDCRR